MTNTPCFSARHNAKRAAERMITVGIAPSIDYGLRENDDGRFEIVWKTENAIIGTEDIEDGAENDADHGPDDVAAADEEFDEVEPVKVLGHDYDGNPITDPLALECHGLDLDGAPLQAPEPDPWPTGSRVKIRRAPRSVTGTVVERVSATHWSVHLDFTQPGEVELFDAEEMVSEAGAAAPRVIVPAKAPAEPTRARKAKSGGDSAGPARKATALDSAAARGIMPEKPVITSKANAGYQKRFDRVAAFADAGDWDAVRDYAINGVNSYAKMLREYRDRLLSAHAASAESRAA